MTLRQLLEQQFFVFFLSQRALWLAWDPGHALSPGVCLCPLTSLQQGQPHTKAAKRLHHSWGRVKNVTFLPPQTYSWLESHPCKCYSCSGCLSHTVGRLRLLKIYTAGDFDWLLTEVVYFCHFYGKFGSLKAKGEADPMTHFNKEQGIL